MGHTILLADDSITIQKVIELTFSDEDFKLHTVGNGQKAVDEVRIVRPDIVLCDIIMPEKNGYEVCEFIKSSPDLKHIPVLLLTGAFEPFDQERARQAGCDGFLAKPFEPQTLISKVKELLASAKKPAAAPAPGGPRPSSTAAVSGAAVASEPKVASPPPISSSRPPQPEKAEVDESFAFEAGEKELSFGPSDRAMFLGQEEPSPTVMSEEIWGEVQQASAPPDEGRTVMMSAASVSPPAGEPFEQGLYGGAGVEEVESAEEAPAGSAEDRTWVLPPEEPAPEPELTRVGAPSEFDSFKEEEPGSLAAPAEPEAGESTVMFTATTSAMAAASGPKPESRPSPAPPSKPAPAAAQRPVPTGATRPAPAAPSKPVVPPPAHPAHAETSFGGRAPEGEFEASPAGVPMSAAEIEELVERVARKVVAQISEKLIQEIAWEVVPDLAETLIKKEIDSLKAKIPR